MDGLIWVKEIKHKLFVSSFKPKILIIQIETKEGSATATKKTKHK